MHIFKILIFFMVSVFLTCSCEQENKREKVTDDSPLQIEAENDRETFSSSERNFDISNTSNHQIKFKTEVSAEDMLVKFNEVMNANPGMLITNTFNHQENANQAGLSMGFSTFHHLYTNQLVNPLIAENPLTALDLPLRIHFFDEDNENMTQFIDGNFLIQRYGLSEGIQTAESNSRVLNSILKNLTDDEAFLKAELNIKKFEGIKILQSTSSFDVTAKTILNNIKNNNEISLLGAHDFQSFADDAGFETGKCILLLFGNPSVGTQLMKEQPSLGIDLPLKLLIYEDENEVTNVAYNDMNFIFQLHGYQNTEVANQMNQLKKSLITGK